MPKQTTSQVTKLADRDISTTFVKGLAVLKAFDDTHTRLTLAEIAQRTNLDRASTRRLTLTLLHLGYAQKDGRHFSLSPKVLVLAGSFLRGNQFGTDIQPLLNRASTQIGATVSLALADEDAAVYVAQSHVLEDVVSFGFTLGSRLPLLHTAIGRMILAYSAQAWAEERIETDAFDTYSATTITDRRVLSEKVAAIRTAGYAIVDGEFEQGVTGFAVPVGGAGTLKAVVGLSKPSILVRDPDEQLNIISQLQQTAFALGQSRMFAGG